MAFCDFVIKYDPDKDTTQDITKRILYSVIIKRLKAHKPAVMFIGGDSGEGKSFASLRLQELLLEIQGLALKEYLEKINVYTPLEYPKKLEALLTDKELKKINIICMHEARDIVKAKLWHSFLNQTIADVNAMSRSIKRLCFIVISQFIRDISTDIRYTLNFYGIIRRPKNKAARLYLNILWKDDRDLDKPKLKKRKLSGYLVYPNGRYRRFVPQYFELSKPSKDIIEEFNKRDIESKSGIIKSKIDSLIKEMSIDIGEPSKKIDLMVDWYIKNPDNLNLIGKRYKNKYRISKEVRKMHDLTDHEVKEFQNKLNDKLKEIQGVENDKQNKEEIKGSD